MEQTIMTCDVCKREERDPANWLAILEGPHYGIPTLMIQPLGATAHSGKKKVHHLCGPECLISALKRNISKWAERKVA